MASVLIVSKYGDGVPLALRMVEERNIVKMYIQDQRAKGSLEGFKNPSTISRLAMPEQYDLVLFDMVGLGERADRLKEQGRTVMGGGTFNDNLELDRAYGEKVASQLMAVQVPKTVRVQTSEECLKHLETAAGPQVIKPLDNKAPSLTLVSSDDRNRTLISLVKHLKDAVTPAIVQERIDGVEVSTEGWFDGKDWVPQLFNHTMEEKRLMEGRRGPQTGCMGNVVWMTNDEGDEIVKRTLVSLTPLLQKIEYVGPLDVNCIATEKELYFLEFTARFGYDALQALLELIKDNLFDILWGVATRSHKHLRVIDEYAIAVRLSMPPYPYEEGCDILKGAQVVAVPDEAKRHVMLSDVMMNEQGVVMVGVDGVVGCVTARGSTIQEIRRRAYRTINNIVLHDDVQYRKDIGAGVENSIERLKTWGWIA